MSPICTNFADKIRKLRIMNSLKRILFQKSHLAPYLPFMKQTLQHKIIRVYNDQSCESNIVVEESHAKAHKKVIKKKHSLDGIFMMSKPCYDPIANWLIAWYVLVFLAIIYTYVEMGLVLTYGSVAWADIHNDPISITFHVAAILVFIGDILVQMNTGYIFRGVIITQKVRVIGQYMRTYFIPDFLLVLMLIASLMSTNLYLNIAKIIVVVKFARMFDIDELNLRKISTNGKAKVLYVICKQFISIFVLSHTIGLFFYAIDLAMTNDPACEANNSLCWLYSATAYSPIINYNWQIQYFYTLYWGINTIATISYGDIAPNNPQQTIYALFCFCFGFMVYGYVVNNIIKVILWARRTSDNFKQELIIYTTFMDNLQINQFAQYEIRDYLEHQFFKEKSRAIPIEEEMKARLPEDLRDQLLKNAYFKLHNHLEYILVKSPSITKLLYFLQEKKYTEDEIILKQGAPLLNLYYLHQGEVNLMCHYGKKMHHISTISHPDTFLSQYQFFVNERATYNITTTTTSTLYILQRHKLEEIIEKHTDLRENFKLIQYELRCCNFKKIFYHCFRCRSNHHWHSCFQTFPNFNNVKLTSGNTRKKRHYKNSCITLKNRSELSKLQRINADDFARLRKMKERVHELSRLKQDMNNYFDVDVCHDWQYFLPEYNFSVFKTAWDDQRKAVTARANTMRLFMAV